LKTGSELGQEILLEQFEHTRSDIRRRVDGASQAARALPIVAGTELLTIGVYGAVVHTFAVSPVIVELAVAASVLVAGFFATSELTTVLYDLALLAVLERRLEVPRGRGYYVEDLAGHHLPRREPGPVARTNGVVLGVRLQNPWVRNILFMNMWSALVVFVVDAAAVYLLGIWWQYALALALAAGVGGLLTVVAWVALRSFPEQVRYVLEDPDAWFAQSIASQAPPPTD
jgi:hypothetical protein